MWIFSNKKGSLTVEAAIVLPLFICLILSVGFIAKLVYMHEIIQHSITETANEIATYSYLYAVSGIEEIDSTTNKGLEDGGQLFKNHLDSFTEGYTSLQAFSEDTVEKIRDGTFGLESTRNTAEDSIIHIKDSFEDTKQKIIEAANSTKETFSNPAEELQSMLCLIGKGAYSDVKTASVLKPVTRVFIKKYLRTESTSDVDIRLKKLNISNGFQGLDFSQSKLFEDGKNIDIVVRYKLDLPMPIKIMPNLYIVQRVLVRGWLNGDSDDSTVGAENQQNIWDIQPQTTRGKIIQEKQGRNLPEKFPVIAKFQNGTAYSIKSIDLEEPSYAKSGNVKSKIKGFISDLSTFKGASYEGTEIKESEIRAKELTIIVPEIEINSSVQKVLDECIADARNKGITLTVIKAYGKKKSSEPEENSTNLDTKNQK